MLRQLSWITRNARGSRYRELFSLVAGGLFMLGITQMLQVSQGTDSGVVQLVEVETRSLETIPRYLCPCKVNHSNFEKQTHGHTGTEKHSHGNTDTEKHSHGHTGTEKHSHGHTGTEKHSHGNTDRKRPGYDHPGNPIQDQITDTDQAKLVDYAVKTVDFQGEDTGDSYRGVLGKVGKVHQLDSVNTGKDVFADSSPAQQPQLTIPRVTRHEAGGEVGDQDLPHIPTAILVNSRQTSDTQQQEEPQQNQTLPQKPVMPVVVKHNVTFRDINHPETPIRGKHSLIHVALGLSITSKKLENITAENIREKFVFFKYLLPSFCQTRSNDTFYVYKFYISYDFTDTFFINGNNRILFIYTFQSIVAEQCFNTTTTNGDLSKQYIWLKLIKCDHSHKPAWAQNDAMMDAYLDNYDYYYRLNDDVIMTSPDWTTLLIGYLRKYDPPNVGMVSPVHTGGHPDHYEFDFVHRTHIDIFGYYYPRVFLDLYADEWIARVYLGFRRCKKLLNVSIVHTQALGKRYNEKLEGGGAARHMFRNNERTRGIVTVNRFMTYFKTYGMNFNHMTRRRIIAMSLAGNDPNDLWGAMRNVFLARVHFSAFRVRFYISDPKIKDQNAVDQRFLSRLAGEGAELVVVDPTFASLVPVPLWKYLALDDAFIRVLLLRDPASRLTKQDRMVMAEYLSNRKYGLVSCFRDFLPASETPLVDNRLTFRAEQLRVLLKAKQASPLKEKMKQYVQTFKNTEDTAEAKTESFLHNFFWSLVKEESYIFDTSVKTDSNATYVHPVPPHLLQNVQSGRWTYIGRKYDAFDTLPVYLQREAQLNADDVDMGEDEAQVVK